MKKEECQSCFKNETLLKCSQCDQASCKDCCIFINNNEFELIELLPLNLKNKPFCPNCYTTSAAPIIHEFNEILELARQVNVYDIDQTQETNRMSRHEKPVAIKDCDDKDEALMCLAFLAAKRGFNTIIDVDLRSVKSDEGGKYKKLIWSGKAFPVNILRKNT